MGIIRATAYPSRYTNPVYLEQEAAKAVEQERRALERKGKLYMTFQVAGPAWRTTEAQREIASVLGRVMNAKPVYERTEQGSVYDRGRYKVGGWKVSCGYSVCTDFFDLETMPRVLEALNALDSRGYVPDGELMICFAPERYDMEMVFNAYTILEARRELVEMALGFEDEARLVVGRDLAFSIPLDAFSLPVIEACACLLYQVSAMAVTTKKARMKPCDMSNPKYQMRSWLLRLGFIGEQFERPRQTLLEQLDGNAAFFDDAGKQKAKDKRRQKKAMALA